MKNDYISDFSKEPDDVLKWLEKQTNLRTNHSRMLCGPIEGKLLEFIVSMMQAKHVLEIGTFTGYSAICLARGLSEGGIVDTIEINDELQDLITEGFRRADVSKKINLHIGRALEIIPTLKNKYDLVFIDANKREYDKYYEVVIDKIRPGGFIIADNVLWSGKVCGETADDNKGEMPNDAQTQGIQRFNELVKKDSRVENIILPIRDGINIIKVINTNIFNTAASSIQSDNCTSSIDTSYNNYKSTKDIEHLKPSDERFSIELAKAAKQDIPTIQHIADIAFRDAYKDILSKEQLEWMMNWMYSTESLKFQMEHDHTFFILKYNNNPSGYISIERQEKTLFHLQKIYLLPDMQGKGLGRVLIEHGIDFVRSFNLKRCKIELNVNRNNKAVKFYERMGFKIDRTGDFDIGNGFYMNDYIMVKEILL